MAIGVNWKEIWQPVWADVWDQAPPSETAEDPIGINWNPIWKQVWGPVWAQEVTPPTPAVISSPLGTATSGTTATAGATTDTPSGTLYGLARNGGSAAGGSTIAATGQSVAVSSTTPSFSYTGLTAYTPYRIDYVQDVGGTLSNVVTSAEFWTDNTGEGGGEYGEPFKAAWARGANILIGA